MSLREELREIRKTGAPPAGIIQPPPEPAKKYEVYEDTWIKREEQFERGQILQIPTTGETPQERTASRLDVVGKRVGAEVRIEQAKFEREKAEFEKQKQEAQKIIAEKDLYAPESFNQWLASWERIREQNQRYLTEKEAYVGQISRYSTPSFGADYLSAYRTGKRETQFERGRIQREVSALRQRDLQSQTTRQILGLDPIYMAPELVEGGYAYKWKQVEVPKEDKGVPPVQGPWWISGPKPGMPGYALKEAVEKVMDPVGSMLRAWDVPFARQEERIRTKAKELEQTGRYLGETGKPWAGLANYLGAVGLRTEAAGFGALSWWIRPAQWTKPIEAVIGLTFVPEYRKAVVREAQRDPFGFFLEMAGGYAGAYAGAKAISYAGGKYEAWKTKKFLEKYPAEKFFVREERLMEYPEAVEVQKHDIIGLSEEMGLREANTTANLKFGIIDESAKWTGTPEGGATLWPKGKWAPGLKEALLRKGGTAVEQLRETPEYVKRYVPIWDVQTGIAHLPGVSTRYLIPEVAGRGMSGLMGVLGLSTALRTGHPTLEKPIVGVKVRTEVILEKRQEQLLREMGIQRPRAPQIQIPKIAQIQIQKVNQDQMIRESLKLEEIQIQKAIQFEKQILRPIQEQKFGESLKTVTPVMPRWGQVHKQPIRVTDFTQPKVKRKGKRTYKLWGEERIYKVKSVEQLLESIIGKGKKKRKKRGKR